MKDRAMKFLWIVFLISCQLTFQVDAMFSFATRVNIERSKELQKKLTKLSEKNPTNLQLQLYLESIKNYPIDETNCYRREKDAQTLLFPLNTNLVERVMKASEQNVPEPRWWRVTEWHKKPIAQCYNMGAEGVEIISDVVRSLRVSDSVAVALGYVCADGVVRRLNNENWIFALAATPLYVAGPLAALWAKKSGFDMYSVMQSAMHGLYRQNKENELNHRAEIIAGERQHQDRLQDQAVRLANDFTRRGRELERREAIRITCDEQLTPVLLQMIEKQRFEERQARRANRLHQSAQIVVQQEQEVIPEGVIIARDNEVWHRNAFKSELTRITEQTIARQQEEKQKWHDSEGKKKDDVQTMQIMPISTTAAGKSLVYGIITGQSPYLPLSSSVKNSSNDSSSHVGSGLHARDFQLMQSWKPKQEHNVNLAHHVKNEMNASSSSVAEAIVHNAPNITRVVLKSFPK